MWTRGGEKAKVAGEPFFGCFALEEARWGMRNDSIFCHRSLVNFETVFIRKRRERTARKMKNSLWIYDMLLESRGKVRGRERERQWPGCVGGMEKKVKLDNLFDFSYFPLSFTSNNKFPSSSYRESRRRQSSICHHILRNFAWGGSEGKGWGERLSRKAKS